MIILPHPSKNFLEEVYNVMARYRQKTFKVILPTVACCIRLQQIIVEKSDNFAAILPEIVSVINVGIEGDSIYEVPNAHIEPISRLEQRILLCSIILDKDSSISISEALDLSVYVMKLFDELSDSSLTIDDFEEKTISFEQEDIMHELVDHWKERVSFLQIIYEKWQETLKSKGRIDFATYQQNMLKREIESAEKKKHLIIMAGIFPKGILLERLAEILSSSDESYLILPPITKNSDNLVNYKTHFSYQANLAIERYSEIAHNPNKQNKPLHLEANNIREESNQILAQIETWLKEDENAKIAIICKNKELINLLENKLNQASIGHINLAGYSITQTKHYEFFISLIESLEQEKKLDIEKLISLLKTKFLYNQESRDFELNLRKNHKLLKLDVTQVVQELKPTLEKHIEVAEKLAPEIWQSIEGRILSDFLYELLQIENMIEMDLESYRDFIKTISHGVKYHKNVSNQKVFFTNLEDADLCGYEYVICASMNEDSIPGKVSMDPWMSPKMRENIGLSDLSEKIGIDWYHYKNLLYRKVVTTRALKMHGSITQSSRFLYASI